MASKQTITEAQKLKKKSHKVHGNKGVYCGGDWIPIEECADWICPKQCDKSTNITNCVNNNKIFDDEHIMYDVAIIGAGCVVQP